jgi:hypothetical protein
VSEPTVRDYYEQRYADKLWTLVPAAYRAADSTTVDGDGPLLELLNRIGASVAVVRRSIDRLWEDQSIETCDDWVIPYIGDLLATNLVPSLDSRGRRLDVAKTIHYRRGAGTLGILEELAHDITGWEVRVVEFFRRLLRTRHLLDPPIGIFSTDDPPRGDTLLQRAEELVGAFTGTPLGGLADLRDAFGAANTDTAFDEYGHYADFRIGRGRTGWYAIPKLGVFVWRLRSYGVVRATPVRCGTSDLFTFDPTGRMMPLFAQAARTAGSAWVPAEEWQMPGPISTPLYKSQRAHLYPPLVPGARQSALQGSVQVLLKQGSFFDPIDACRPDLASGTRCVTVFPELGTFRIEQPPGPPPPPTPPDQLAVSYYYGFSSEIGAGPFDRRRVIEPSPLENPQPPVEGGGSLTPGAAGTWTIADSRTYDTVSNPAGSIADQLTITCADQQRPLIRLASDWTFDGSGGRLTLEGLFVSGADVVLTGSFDTVRLACCTLDPGNTNTDPNASTIVAQSVDGKPLAPTRLVIQAEIQTLELDHCILGPVRENARQVVPPAGSAQVEHLTINDSIIQGIGTGGTGPFVASDVQDVIGFLSRLITHPDVLATYVWNQLSAGTRQMVQDYLTPAAAPPSQGAVVNAVLGDINTKLVQGGASIYDPDRFRGVVLDPDTLALTGSPPAGAGLAPFNRVLLEEGFPDALGELALMVASAEVDLARCTVLGPGFVHRINATESILDDMFVTEDIQHGCIRFSAWSTGSALPRQYESVEIAPHAPIFTSRDFGDPGYCQLRSGTGAVASGGPNGSEMGAFARERNAIKERSLLLKYQEFMPLGLTPVVIDVT